MSETIQPSEAENPEDSDYSVDDILKSEKLFEFHSPFKDNCSEDIVGRLDWYNAEEQAQLMLLCEKLGINEENTLALAGFVHAIQRNRQEFVTIGLEIDVENIIPTKHPMMEPFDSTVCDLRTPSPGDTEDLGYDVSLLDEVFSMTEEDLIKGLERLEKKWVEAADTEGLETTIVDEGYPEDYEGYDDEED